MNRDRLFGLLSAVCVLMLLGMPLSAGQCCASKPLFAADLSNAQFPEGAWTLENGVLTAHEDENIWTDRKYEQFVLELEFKNEAYTNSGVFVYGADPEKWVTHSVEVQILNDHADFVAEWDPSWKAGAFYGQKRPIQSDVVRPAGEWNTMVIYANGPRILVKMNGLWVNSIDLRNHQSAEVAPDGTQIPEWLSVPLSELETVGYIGLQGKHGKTPVHFRNLTVRDLSEEEKAFVNERFEPLVQSTASGLTLGQGVNVSHWLSQRDPGMPDPREYFTVDDVAFIKSQGFDHIRLPIDESEMWYADGTRNQVSFETLDTAIQWIYDAGMTVVVDLHIINSHHFNAQNDEGENTLFTNPESQEHLVNLWRELSDFLSKWCNSFLAYEILNEAVAEDHDDWNRLLKKCITAIRELEPERPIVMGSNRWQMTETFPYFRVPKGDPNLILSFHFYSPFPFTHYRAHWVGAFYEYEGPVSYPGLLVSDEVLESLPEGGEIRSSLEGHQGPNDKETLRISMFPSIEFARVHRLPLYCGEWGALKTVQREDMLHWYRDMGEILREEEIHHAIWDYKGSFSIVNHDTGEADMELIDAILGR